MSVNDLTNTIWRFNEDVDLSVFFNSGEDAIVNKNINFTSNNNSYNQLAFKYNYTAEEYDDNDEIIQEEENHYLMCYGAYSVSNPNNHIYDYDEMNGIYWKDGVTDENDVISSVWQDIEITGGADATDSTLIAWLESNATQQASPTPSEPVSNIEMWFGDRKIESISFVQNGTTKDVVDTSLDLPKPLQECTWTEIKQICKNGDAKKYWQVGDTKTITCTDGYTYTIRIVDMQEGRYKYVSDNSPTHCVFELQQTYSTTQYLASSGASEVGLYKNTPMHTTYLPNILKTFNDIKNVLENVYITCLTSINDDTYESVSAKVFLPSAVEYMDYTLSTSSFNARMNMERISPYDNTQYDVFDYYKTHSAEKKKITDGQTANTYWTRLYQISTYWNVMATPLNQSGTSISSQYPAIRNGSPTKSWVIFCFAL